MSLPVVGLRRPANAHRRSGWTSTPPLPPRVRNNGDAPCNNPPPPITDHAPMHPTPSWPTTALASLPTSRQPCSCSSTHRLSSPAASLSPLFPAAAIKRPSPSSPALLAISFPHQSSTVPPLPPNHQAASSEPPQSPLNLQVDRAPLQPPEPLPGRHSHHRRRSWSLLLHPRGSPSRAATKPPQPTSSTAH